jgi:DNA-binding transcriptional MerR regulator
MAAVPKERSTRPMTIGAVCKRLKEEFPDISISKIRYLEDQGLLTLSRTHGGYRLFSEEDFERLRAILRMQRDEFLPLRVIREELTTPGGRGRRERKRAAASGLRARGDVKHVTFEELCEQTGAQPAFVRELEEYGLIEAENGHGSVYPESDAGIVAVCAQLARFGIEPRNLRAVRTSIDRETALIEALVAPALRSRNPERRQGGLKELESLAALTVELSQLLFWRSLRGLVARS